MRALVTGGAGFIGSHVVDLLLARGDQVVVIDDLSTGRRENLAAALEQGAQLVEADITDPDPVAAAFAEHEPEAVLHLAAQMDVRVSVADPLFDLRVNVAGTINLLEQIRRRERCRIVFASTGGAIYGEGAGRELPLTEEAECMPDAPYGLSKQCAEGYLALYSRLYGVEATALRLGNVYGPRQDPHGEAGVVAIFIGALLGGQRPRVFGDGEQTRDYIYVADVAAAFIAAIEAAPGGPYNVGTGIETGVLELGRRVAAACGAEFDPEHAAQRPGEVERIAIDPSRAAGELGWRAGFDLDRGLAQTVASFRGT
jgi:UDP-glucose 4-epimerase